jgi:arylformamidase
MGNPAPFLKMKIYDLSPLLDAGTPVWPGDTALRREVLLDLANGDNITLSTLHGTVHLGSHADAPSHYARSGRTIDEMELERYVGAALLLDAPCRRGSRFGPEILPDCELPARVLLRTGSWHSEAEPFDEEFAALEPALIEALSLRGVRLVGVDTPSVDLFASKGLPAHRACAEHDVAIVEGLVLKGVPAGAGELICLPLRLKGFDASPVRALFRLRDNL